MFRSAYVLLALLLALPALAQPRIADDPHDGDPTGIVAEPCPGHARPEDEAARRIFDLHQRVRDFGGLCRYAAANRALAGAPVKVVFIGDSITDSWIRADPGLFTNGVVDRGIGGQTSAQMLVRFRQDVIALRPQAVHIMAGTNDVAGNSGPATMETVLGHIRSMAELARAHGIVVILASVPPAATFSWRPQQRPAPQIAAINAALAAYAREQGLVYVDYHAALAQEDGAMKPGLARDGVHPTPQGYAVMRPLALAAIERALARRAIGR